VSSTSRGSPISYHLSSSDSTYALIAGVVASRLRRYTGRTAWRTPAPRPTRPGGRLPKRRGRMSWAVSVHRPDDHDQRSPRRKATGLRTRSGRPLQASAPRGRSGRQDRLVRSRRPWGKHPGAAITAGVIVQPASTATQHVCSRCALAANPCTSGVNVPLPLSRFRQVRRRRRRLATTTPVAIRSRPAAISDISHTRS